MGAPHSAISKAQSIVRIGRPAVEPRTERAVAEWTLIVGNRNYSSWSLRGYLAVAQTGVAFDVVVLPLDRLDSKQRLRAETPAGLVPALRGPDGVVWDSLAIAEYCADRFPAATLWPADRPARAHARAVSAEMHSGFAPLRAHMPMDMRSDRSGVGRTPEVLANIERITGLWRHCRETYGAGGPFLFGTFTIADAMYAPVCSRFRTYAVDLDAVCGAYAAAIWEHPPMARWLAAARDEPWTIEHPVV
jgi:glutathione S-transferase